MKEFLKLGLYWLAFSKHLSLLRISWFFVKFVLEKGSLGESEGCDVYDVPLLFVSLHFSGLLFTCWEYLVPKVSELVCLELNCFKDKLFFWARCLTCSAVEV